MVIDLSKHKPEDLHREVIRKTCTVHRYHPTNPNDKTEAHGDNPTHVLFKSITGKRKRGDDGLDPWDDKQVIPANGTRETYLFREDGKGETFTTQDSPDFDDKLKAVYGDTMCAVNVEALEVSFTVKETSIHLRHCRWTRNRKVGHRHFARTLNSTVLKIDLKTGDFFISRSELGQKVKRTKSTVSKSAVGKALQGVFENFKHEDGLSDVLMGFYKATAFINLSHPMSEFLRNRADAPLITKRAEENVCLFMYTMKKVKVPNNFGKYLDEAPKIADVRKHGNSFVAAILAKHNINQPFYHRVVNELTPELKRLAAADKFFTMDTLHNFYKGDKEGFKRVIEKMDEPAEGFVFNWTDEDGKRHSVNYEKELNEHHRRWAYRVMTLEVKDHEQVTWGDIKDHFKYWVQLRHQFNLPITLEHPSTAKNFHREHRYMSNNLRFLGKTKFDYRVFPDDEVITKINAPITVDKKTKVFPVLLHNDIDYGEESDFQVHCVHDYVNANKSVVVSLRHKPGQDDEERVTCEFRIDDKGKEVRLAQGRTYHNHDPKEWWQPVMAELTGRMSQCPEIFDYELKSLTKKEYNELVSKVGIIDASLFPKVLEAFMIGLSPVATVSNGRKQRTRQVHDFPH